MPSAQYISRIFQAEWGFWSAENTLAVDMTEEPQIFEGLLFTCLNNPVTD